MITCKRNTLNIWFIILYPPKSLPVVNTFFSTSWNIKLRFVTDLWNFYALFAIFNERDFINRYMYLNRWFTSSILTFDIDLWCVISLLRTVLNKEEEKNVFSWNLSLWVIYNSVSHCLASIFTRNDKHSYSRNVRLPQFKH